MPSRHLRMTGTDGAALRTALRELRRRLGIPPGFPAGVLAEAEQAARAPRLPAQDATDIPLYSVDPPASRNPGRAMHLARRPGGGYRVHYAVPDITAYITPGGALDAEAHRRVTTLDFPDGRVPLYPAVLSEGAASLSPGQDQPALLWRFELDSSGGVIDTHVRRALVRSRATLDHETVQRSIDGATAEEPVALLRDIGRFREERERARGGISLVVPEQQIIPDGESYALDYRAVLPADGWTAQISLLAGMAAARLLLRSHTGVLRTLPTATGGAVTRLHRVARALAIDWPKKHTSYADVIRSLDPRRTNHAAFLQECGTLLRGGGYTVFTGQRPLPDHTVHAAVAAEYTHCMAPLRRLIDRYTGELCLAAVAGAEPPEWVLAVLADLPEEMAEGTRRADEVEGECVELVAAAVMSGRVGEVFDAYVVEEGTVQVHEPAVLGRMTGSAVPLGEWVRARLTGAAPGRESVRFVQA
ncbi:RNB domain-containing ribonuclease [Streptomyces gobiensis]|uniref:RNB domain-containing ribonuclease n=1 Tax=Streptomyces gobiensis TaxID=2875706 RepID=UPI001E575FD9|nr:RNB domain-containing ribonuclease [Streptomyces gobiensis]UGY91103.1 RNB domain-containing ribonuclease [Streptomyces gobiensis]